MSHKLIQAATEGGDDVMSVTHYTDEPEEEESVELVGSSTD